ncbi:hypothetical protein [Deinococcus budaensis]|uniref:Uncharacterized protein n=1 Tax=Deinococcus budaensis TaxID=1665626 RepID=A0A7W8GF57_9DEIO|nr:hypothetical protein [Deinococcus budaensis]MBB5234477.1 hypothetical protein [Deinococcus budaensis]
MPKTAQQWKDTLGLDELPDADYLALLNEAEGQEASGGTLPPDRFVEMTPGEIAAAVVLGSAGAAFKAIRTAQGLTVRKAGEAWGMTSGRVSQIEAEDANLYMSTVGDTAHRMGYRAKLLLEPLDGGPAYVAELPHS